MSKKRRIYRTHQEKLALVREAQAKGFKATGRLHGINPGSLHVWARGDALGPPGHASSPKPKRAAAGAEGPLPTLPLRSSPRPHRPQSRPRTAWQFCPHCGHSLA